VIIRELLNRIGFKVDDAQMKKAGAKVKAFAKTAGKVGLGVAAGVAAIGVAAIKSASDMEMLTTQFEVMLGSADKATAMMEELKTFSASTPFALNDLAKGSQQLLSFGVASGDVVNTMRMLGDTAGGNAEKLNGLVLAYGKVQTKGKVSMEELNMMAERGLPIYTELMNVVGAESRDAFFKMVSAGKIGKEAVTQAFNNMTSEGGMFFQGMKKQSLTFQGMLSTMMDNIKLLLAELGTQLLPLVKTVVETVIELLKGPMRSVLEEVIKTLTPILKKLPGLIAPLMKIVLLLHKIGGPILILIVKILDPILSGVDFVANKLEKIMGHFSDGGFQNTLSAIQSVVKQTRRNMPIIDHILQKIRSIGKQIQSFKEFLSPLYDLVIKVINTFGTFYNNILRPVMEFILKVSSVIWQLIFDIVGIILNLLKPVIKFVTWIYDRALDLAAVIIKHIGKPIQDVMDWATKKLEQFIKLLNNIHGIDIMIPEVKLPKLDALDGSKLKRDTASGLQKMITTAENKTQNISVDTKVDMTVPPAGSTGAGGAGAGTVGMSQEQAKTAMKQAAQTAFSIELRKILISAG
jgi:tape measure domain-containing protein